MLKFHIVSKLRGKVLVIASLERWVLNLESLSRLSAYLSSKFRGRHLVNIFEEAQALLYWV